ncbi:helix-turn-helix domain-containing protein [Amycolatopsis plumensis]|uniref:Helix-turn-helix domain-containing protein n=1 Tax=Amycolatopsis plumensis TaxID=236508 RepID=A0ABV5U8P2_9PSEU
MAENKASAKSAKIGAHLRAERVQRDVTLTAFADEVGISKAHLSRIETGISPVKVEDVARMLTLLGVRGERFDQIVAMVNGDEAQHGWTATTLSEQAAMNAALADFEANAATITDGALVLLPGLVQDSGYTRAIMSGGTVPAHEISARVAMRAGRGAVIDPNRTRRPVTYKALIDEAALRKCIGGREVMADALRFLHKIATEWSNATIRIVPDRAGWYPGMTGAFSMIEPRDKAALSIVHLGTRRSGQILDQSEDLAEYARTVDAGEAVALSKDESAERIATAIEEMEKG